MNHTLKIENQKFKYFFIITVGGDKFLSYYQCCSFQIVRENNKNFQTLNKNSIVMCV